jgi:hypothetical protein
MNASVLTIVLTVLALSKAPQQTSTEQPCTGPTLVGTWQLVKSGGEATPDEGSRSLKHVTPTHFFVLSVDATGLASYGHGGPYTVSGGKYTESITHGFGAPFTQLLRGMSISFQCSLEKDMWHIVGEIGGQTFDERWRRVPPAAAK